MNGIIYKIINKINKKGYIGKTTQSLEKRWSTGHCCEAKNGSNCVIHRAIRKYGSENFEILILNEYDIKYLDLMETFMIIIHHTHSTEGGYNETWGGEGTFGYKHTKKTKKKISEKKYGIKLGPMSEEIKEKHRKPRGPMPEETKKKLRCPKTKKAKENNSISHRKTWKVIDPNGNEYVINNMKKFCLDNNLPYTRMKAINIGLQKQHKGYTCKVISN